MSDLGVLLPYQLLWVLDESTVSAWEKSRRVGASYAEALKSVRFAMRNREAGGQSTYYLSYNKEMTQQFVKDSAYWAKVLNAAVSDTEEVVLWNPDGDITVYRIRFASGFDIWGLPSEPRSLRSKQGRVVIDEAAFVDDLAGLIKAAMALLMWGGSVSILSTHNGEDNAFNELVKDIRAGKRDYSLHRTTLDDALADGLYRKICQSQGKPWTREAEDRWRERLITDYGEGADEELFCIPNRSSGAYLTSAMIEACMADGVPVITWTPPAEDFVDWSLTAAEVVTKQWLREYVDPLLAEVPAGRCHFVGGDFGRSGDLSVFWPVTEQADLTLATQFTVELRNCPYRTQQHILFHIIDSLPRFSGLALDARGNGSALAEFARQEYGPAQVEEVMISESWYRETMPKLKSRIEDKTIVLPKNADVLSDLRSLRVVKGVARVPDARGKDATGKRHGDAAVALAMAIHAREKLGGVEPWSCETVDVLAGQRFSFDGF